MPPGPGPKPARKTRDIPGAHPVHKLCTARAPISGVSMHIHVKDRKTPASVKQTLPRRTYLNADPRCSMLHSFCTS